MCVHLEDVTRAALNLQGKGGRVTTRTVREALGRGSYSTISRLLAELGLRALGGSSDPVLSDTIRLQAVALAQAVWRAAERAQIEKTSAAEYQWRLRLSIVVKQLNEEKQARCAQDKALALLYSERQEWRAERGALKQEIVALTKQSNRAKESHKLGLLKQKSAIVSSRSHAGRRVGVDRDPQRVR